jgi:hypothetical protein
VNRTTPRTLALTLAVGLGLAAAAPTAAGAIGGYSTPLPQLTVELDDAVEDAGHMEGRVRLSSPLDEELTANLRVHFPDAGPEDVVCENDDTEYCTNAFTVDIPAGATEADFEVDLVTGDGAEDAEVLRIVIDGSYPFGRARKGNPAEAVIYDGDGLDLALADDPEAPEGDPGSDGTLGLVVEADQAVPHPVTFRIRTSPAGGYNAATPTVDHQPIDLVVELPAGDTEVTVEVPLVGDQLDEATQELFFGHIEDLSHGEVALSGSPTVARITDDDAPVVTWKTPGGYQSPSRSARSAALTA